MTGSRRRPLAVVGAMLLCGAGLVGAAALGSRGDAEVSGAATEGAARGGAWPGKGGALDITHFRRTFYEDFEHFDVSAWGPDSRWIAHTPWHGDFGDAAFADPEPGFPFQTASRILRIEARKGPDGRWRSGLIAGRDRRGAAASGFAQRYGYFEIDTKLPPGLGTWPAFWLSSIDEAPNAEIDVFEYYGNAPASYHSNVHSYDAGREVFGDGAVVPIPEGAATAGFNRYGVLVERDWITFFFNRRAVWRTPTRPEDRRPFYMLADLALGSGWPIDRTPNPSFMYVRSISAYAATR